MPSDSEVAGGVVANNASSPTEERSLITDRKYSPNEAPLARGYAKRHHARRGRPPTRMTTMVLDLTGHPSAPRGTWHDCIDGCEFRKER